MSAVRIPMLSEYVARTTSPASDGPHETSGPRLHVADIDPMLRHVVAEATRYFQLPIVCISVTIDDAPIFVSSAALRERLLDGTELPPEWARFASAEARDAVAEDAAADPVLRHSPLVTREGIRCHASTPLVTSEGLVLGALSVMGHAPRQFSAADLVVLRTLADLATRHLERRRQG